MSRKKSIALIIDKIDNSFYDSMVKGARMAAQELGINLLVVSHGHVHSGDNSGSVRYQDFYKVDYQKNTLMSVCMTDSVDLIILDPDSLCENSNDSSKLMSMLSKKKKLIIGDNIPGYACIQYDNKKGVREALEYLIKEKDCTRIAMLAGPKDNKDANERLEAYKEVMAENGLPILPGMIEFGDFTIFCMDEARTLVENNPGVQAYFCANDQMGIALYRVLKEKDVRIGRDVFVIGFDNSSESTRVDPQLATVNADSVSLGYEAVVLGARMIDGEQPGATFIDSFFVPRPSCGFEPYSEIVQIERRRDVGFNSFYDVDRISEKVVEFVFTGIVHDYQAECQKKLIEDSIRRIISRYFGNVVKRNTSDDIYNEFASMIERGGLEYTDPNRLFRVFDTIYNMYCAKDMTMTGRSEVEALLSKMKRKVVELLSVKADNIRKIAESIEGAIARFSTRLMHLDGGMENECVQLMESLEVLGVMDAYLFLYDEPVRHDYGDIWHLPDSLLLKAYRSKEDKAVSVPRSRQRVKKDEIVGNLMLTGRIAESFMLIDLFYGIWQYGILLLDIGAEYNNCLDIIGCHLCSAVNGMIMREREREFLLERDAAVEVSLGYVEEEIDVAGFLEYREFEGMAGSMMPTGQDGGIMVVSALYGGALTEMDLQYGSRIVKDIIKQCGSILKEAYTENAVFGYMGEGVFASFCVVKDPDFITDSAQKISDSAGELFPIVKTAVCAFRFHEELMIKDMLLETKDRVLN